MRKRSLSIAVFLTTFFAPHLFSANLIDDQKEEAYSTQPNNQVDQPKQPFDDEKSSNASDVYIISNPLVLIVGIQEYPYCNYKDLSGVERDMTISYDLFVNKCDYVVKSTYHDGPSKVGKVVRKSDLDNFLHEQYNHLHEKRETYDALIFLFSGHGGGTKYGSDTLITSDGKEVLFMDVVSKFTPNDENFSGSFAYKPKVFFKLACRGGVQSKVVQMRGNNGVYKKDDWIDPESEVFIAYASTPSTKVPDYVGGKYLKILSDLVLDSISNKKDDLSEITRKIRRGLQGDQVTETFTRLNSKVFFAPRRPIMNETMEKEWWNAIQKGEANKLKEILKKYNVDINAKKEGKTALHYAAALNHVEAAKALIKEKAKVNLQDKDGHTPLYEAAAKDSVEVAQLLLKGGAEKDAQNKQGWAALHIASEQGHLCSVDVLLKAGANKNIRTNHWLGFGSTPIDLARAENKKSTVKLLQGNLATGDLKEEWFNAAEKGQLAKAKLLRQRGANIKEEDKYGYNALHFACKGGSVEMVTWLLDECKLGLESKTKLFKKPFIGYWDFMRLTKKGRTPFLFATNKGHLGIAKLLKDRGANIHATDKDGCNALHFACEGGSVEMFTWLLDVCNIDIESKGEYGWTPFIFAAEEGKLAIAKLLRQRGANVKAKGDDGWNALHWACKRGNVKMITWLLDVCKIDIESRNSAGRTPFIYPALTGDLAIAKLLRKRGANIYAKDKDGDNALKLAWETKMISYLKSLGLTKD